MKKFAGLHPCSDFRLPESVPKRIVRRRDTAAEEVGEAPEYWRESRRMNLNLYKA
jgi:hypothetical protein